MSLGHRINRTRDNSRSNALIETFHRYRGAAIRALSEDINVEHMRTSDCMIAGIVTCLLADVQQGGSSNWRCHLDGTHRIITLRGSLRALAGSETLDPLLHCFLCIAILGNTTSPASDLCMATSHFNEVDLIVGHYGYRAFAFQMCPQPLLAEIIRVNYLRQRATNPTVTEDISHEAYGILSRINAFSSDNWAGSRLLSKEDWILVGKTYQTAVALYCISSLQSVSVLPLSSSLRDLCFTHGQLLHILLTEALGSPRINRFMLWPLVVLGVEAVNGDLEMRSFVEKQLPEMSRQVGTSVPLTAKAVIERFWASGETKWDACFDRPYVFVTQIAVDLQQLIPYS
ncbi:transcriptional regulator family: Fungal Specific TF [Paecilomyces variotii]|nr:transcriptional regulator family: Fungal Specific TF [Paecilomyces variotii]KAJ9235007.1 transcriptional regulator family: Fungal Specific TF [Paecilomyces variotii]KAJ9260752.1 transcriptional regulator family: Fungal Specific TF [Paecilomyces variotii]KAJ9348911.1 transcriptional regulator family: Fungal Specific TF [Paecilomyces variotii]KAJ9367182.1 transcriptional regulator family: Fungal Specific TF [Paecilomyces variotii]